MKTPGAITETPCGMPTIIEADPLSEATLSRNQSLEKDHPLTLTLTKKSKTVIEHGTQKHR